MKKYCYTCMEEIRQGNYCMTCMKENQPDRFGHHIKPGTILNGRYLVGNCLGEGGFGITYIGRDLTLDIKVAIKEYYPNGYVSRTNDLTQMVTTTTESQRDFFEKGKKRFLQEARNIAKFIGEPGIVDVREYFEENNTAYIIMEYLDGEDLNRYIRKHGTFEAEKLFKLILPMVDSLQKIHDAKIIHRDISPDNIMYRKNGSLTLMDFGSARFITNEAKELSVMLKQGYAPEEQYRKNGDQGAWTDVYGLCATLYRCITGTVPEDALDRMRADDLKKPSEMPGVKISEPLENVLMSGLAVFKENRCQSMKELAEHIRKALKDPVDSSNNGNSVGGDDYKTIGADEDDHDFKDNRVITKICPRCKAKVSQDVNYCTNCGYDFQANQYNHGNHGGGGNNKLLYAILCAVVALLGVIVFFLISGGRDGGNDSETNAEPTAVVETATPEPTETPEPTPTPTPEPDYLLPDSATRYLTQADLYGLTREELCFARNEIFARHGRMFNTPAIASYFAGKDWYHGTIPPDQFSADILNVYERANIELITKVEDTMGGSYY